MEIVETISMVVALVLDRDWWHHCRSMAAVQSQKAIHVSRYKLYRYKSYRYKLNKQILPFGFTEQYGWLQFCDVFILRVYNGGHFTMFACSQIMSPCRDFSCDRSVVGRQVHPARRMDNVDSETLPCPHIIYFCKWQSLPDPDQIWPDMTITCGSHFIHSTVGLYYNIRYPHPKTDKHSFLLHLSVFIG